MSHFREWEQSPGTANAMIDYNNTQTLQPECSNREHIERTDATLYAVAMDCGRRERLNVHVAVISSVPVTK